MQPIKAGMDLLGPLTNLLNKGETVNLEFTWQSTADARFLTQSI